MLVKQCIEKIESELDNRGYFRGIDEDLIDELYRELHTIITEFKNTSVDEVLNKIDYNCRDIESEIKE